MVYVESKQKSVFSQKAIYKAGRHKYNHLKLMSEEYDTGGDFNIELFIMPLSLALLFITVLVDVRTNRIPNIILIFLVILQINSVIFSYSTIDGTFAFQKFGSRCLTVFLIFIFLFVFFSIGGLGAGDLKLLLVLLPGLSRPVEFVALVFIVAAVFSIIHMLINRNFYERLAVLWNYLWQVLLEGKILPYYTEKPHIDERLRHSIHLSIPIFIAYFIVTFHGLRAV